LILVLFLIFLLFGSVWYIKLAIRQPSAHVEDDNLMTGIKTTGSRKESQSNTADR